MRALLLVGAAAVAGAGCGGTTQSGLSEPDYVRANERLLETLPRFPGARQAALSSAPYFHGDSESSPPSGYTTNVVYEVPEHVAQRAVIDFYVARLPGWSPRIEYAPGVDVKTGVERPGAWAASFTREGALVHVNTDNLIAPGGRRFEVAVDHRRAA